MKILGISAYYHDSAAALIEDGKIVAAAQEERFTRKKHDSAFPLNAIQYCLKELEIDMDGISAVVFYDKPLTKFERLLETYLSYAPKGLPSFLMAMPVTVWLWMTKACPFVAVCGIGKWKARTRPGVGFASWSAPAKSM